MSNTPFKRSDWNAIIQQVNDILQNPPDGCDPLPPIDEVGPNHIWTFGDIEEVQEALIATCATIEFEETPELWKQSIIDEINDAIGEAWCDCVCDEPPIPAEDGLEFVFFSIPSGPAVEPPEEALLSSLINGIVLGAPDIPGRTWAFFERLNLDGNILDSDDIVIQLLPCDGVVNYAGSETVITSTIGEDVTVEYILRLDNP